MTDPIERVTVTHLQIPFKEPFRISGGEVAVKDALLVSVETRSGIGHGESSPMAASFGYSNDTPEGCWDELTTRLAPALLGRTFATTADIAALCDGLTGSRFAVAGVETACWDLLAKVRKSTVADLLGVAPDRIAQGVESGLAVGLYPTVVQLLKVVETHLAEGYRRVKIKIQPGHDVELVRAVRQHFGDIPLMVDANGAYSASDVDVFKALDEFDLLMYEQPTPADDVDGLLAIQSAVATPVCLDETADTLGKTEDALRRGAARVVNLKIQRVGGLGPALRLHNLCAGLGAACWVGTMPELGIGQAQGIHLATLANCRYPTDVEPSARWFVDDYVVPALELQQPGIFSVPSRPGLGFEVDDAKVRRYQVRTQEFRS